MGTLIDNNTKKLMLIKKQKELDALFAEQEMNRRMSTMRKMNGMMKKAQTGMEVDGPTLPLDEPAYQPQPWDYMTGTPGAPGQYLNTTEPTQTADNAFNLKDTLQVYGPEFMKKLPSRLGTIASMAPVFANIFSGKATQLKPQDYYNTRRNDIMSLMRDRRVDIGPQMAAILGGERSALYNLRNTAGSRGELMGNSTAISNRAMASRAGVLANKQNMDLGYKGEEAQALMNLGNQESQVNWNTRQWNEQSLANKRNMFRAGLSQLSQYGQISKLMKNQKLQDENKMATLQDIFAQIAPFMDSFKNFQYSN